MTAPRAALGALLAFKQGLWARRRRRVQRCGKFAENFKQFRFNRVSILNRNGAGGASPRLHCAVEAGPKSPDISNFSDWLQANAKARAPSSPCKNTKGVVMIFRAVFWIGLVSLLTPHEPDLGLGRPGAGTGPSLPVSVLAASGLSRLVQSCGGACAGGPTGLGAAAVRTVAQPLAFSLPGGAALADNLARVRADIEQARQARGPSHAGL